MTQEKTYAVPNISAPNSPVIINPETCIGCNECVEVCPIDVFIPNPEKGESPIILHPEECWYEGCCVFVCPKPGAIRLNWPVMQRVGWKRVDTGEYFRA